MTISAQEQQVRLQFLEEAQDYVDQIETGLLGVGLGEVKGKQLDAVLRAAHSIKGGAAMMSFTTLSKIGHRLEDSLKILRHGQKPEAVNSQLEKDLLNVVDRLRRVIDYNRQGKAIPADWLATEVDPILERLYERLGDPQAMDEASLLAEEDGEDDIVAYLFESEVDAALQHLEDILNDPNQPALHSELEITAETLNGLAEMIELPALAALCTDIAQKLAQYPDQYQTIAELAVGAWRRSQSLVMIGNREDLPTEIEGFGMAATAQPSTTVATGISLADFSEEVSEHIDTVVPTAQSLDLFNFAVDFPSAEKADELANMPSLNDLNLFGDLPIAPTPTSSFNATIDELFSSDELLNMPGLTEVPVSHLDPEMWSDLAAGGSLPTDASLETVALTSGDLTPTDDAADTRPELTDQPDLEWVNSPAPDTDFFSLLKDIDIPDLPKGIQSNFLEDIEDEGQTGLEDAPSVMPETYNTLPDAPEQTIRVGINQLTEIGDLFGEFNISRSGLSLQIGSIRSLLRDLTDKVSHLEAASSQLRNAYDKIASQAPSHAEEFSSQDTATGDFDLLEMDRYGEFHLLSQAVIETVVQIQEKVTDIDIQLNETESVTRDISRTSRQMQNSFTGVRMLPFSEVVSRFPRAIREMAIEHGKEVDLVIKGGGVLIERNVAEILKDPLMHLLRNCFDHGIELPADRLAAGKSAIGKIEIIASYRGNQTVIVMRDDGKGMDLQKIRAKALKMGIDEDILQTTGEKELLDLIFEPGFSTAEKVTDLSGRGVGMDVVRTNLREAQGEIQIETLPGLGSTFVITVPFTLSVVKTLIVEINRMLFAFPINSVEEMILPQPEQFVTRNGQQFIDWEEFQIRLLDMREFFKSPGVLPPADLNIVPKIDHPAVFLAADGDRLYGLQVDRFWNEQEVTIRQPQGVIPLPTGLSGSAILGDGRVVPLVDPLAIARWVDQMSDVAIEALADDLTETTLDREELVMVVDDSINVRRFVALTLERNGYRVEQAKDGQDALEKIQAGLLPTLVICDLEMPRMDGYGFLAKVKALPETKHIPVVMLTSRSGQKHRKIAMNLGASDYFAKPFNEADMLATIHKLINS